VARTRPRGAIIDLDKITGALFAVVPIIGGRRWRPASNIVDLAGFPDELDEEPI